MIDKNGNKLKPGNYVEFYSEYFTESIGTVIDRYRYPLRYDSVLINVGNLHINRKYSEIRRLTRDEILIYWLSR